MKTSTRFSLGLAGCVVACTMAGCVSSADRGAMVPPGMTATHHTSQPVRVAVTGGSTLTAIQGPGVSNEDLQQALESSLVQSGLFKSVGTGGYQLDAFIAQVDQPVMGFSMRVNLEVDYNLRRGGSSVWHKAIKSTYVAPTSEAFAGTVRLRKATEGAARENIAELIRQLNSRRP